MKTTTILAMPAVLAGNVAAGDSDVDVVVTGVVKDYDGKPAKERTIDPRDIELKPADQIWSAKAPLAGFASGHGMEIPPFSLHVLSWKVQ